MKEISIWLLTGNNLAIVASIGLAIISSLYIIYNVCSFYILRERYHGIRFTTKNIAYITMFTAVSVSVTVVISLTIPITVFPPIRIAIEGVMVKIVGLIFGPIVGLIVGLITEILVMLMVPSFIHPAFIIVICAYGLISGIGLSFKRLSEKNNWIIMILITIFLSALLLFFTVIISFYPDKIPFLGMHLSTMSFNLIFGFGIGITLVGIWAFYITMSIRKKHAFLNQILPIILVAIACEYISTTIISAWGDTGFLILDKSPESGGYILNVILRLIQAPLKIVINTAILYFTYVAVSPLIKNDR
ncbi:ECF transporter S component [Spiroplasma endosymbiont of Panorpa germanica]|uniref:ECF transporter S component n=1 Tax=Spiroplasma endosymbiont of Panorpa germanica TaxID=3066314 RepID=UPI0030CB54EA